MQTLFSHIVKYFVRGLIFLVPMAVTVYVIVEIFIIIDSIIPYEIPGLGLLTLLVSITVFGLLASTVLAQPFIHWGNRLLKKAPMVKTIYTSIKDLVTAFVGTHRKFDQPVLVRVSADSEMQKLGFVTGTDLTDIGVGADKVAVYIPHSYAWSGNLFIVPSSHITPVEASPSDVMKFIVSGGVTRISDFKEE